MKIKRSFVTNSSSAGFIVMLKSKYDFNAIYEKATPEIDEFLDHDPESDDEYNFGADSYREEVEELLLQLETDDSLIQDDYGNGPSGTALDLVMITISYGAGQCIQSFDLGPDSLTIVNLGNREIELIAKTIGEICYES